MTRRRRLGSALCLLFGPFLLVGCDLLMTEPAGPAEIAISFQVDEAPIGGTAAAFSRVRRISLRFARADGSFRDTVVAAVPVNGVVRTGISLQSDERIDALGIAAQLGFGALTLFEGAAVVRIEPGTPTTAAIPLVPVPASVEADRALLTLSGPGASAQLASAILYASGDTIDGLQGVWLSEDPTIVAVSPGGLATAQRVGQTRLEVRLDTLADTVLVDVPAPLGRLRTWTNASGGAWTTASNWSGGIVPSAGDSVRVTLDGTYTVSLDASPGALASLTVGATVGQQQLATNGITLSVGGDVSIVDGGSIRMTASTLTAPAVAVAPSSALALRLGSTVNAPVANGGLLVADQGAGSVAGAVTTSGASTIRVGGGVDVSALTIASGFVNNGSVELGGSSRLTISTGTLVNAPSASVGTIASPLGGGTFLTAELDNRGSVSLPEPITIDAPGASHANSGAITSAVGGILTVTGADAFDNSGTLDASNATVDMSFTGAGAGFTMSGPVTVQSGAQVVIRNGPFTQTASTVTGTGVLQLVGLTGSLTGPVALGVSGPTFLQVINSTLVAPVVSVPTATSLLLQDGSTLTAGLNLQGVLSAIGAGTSTVDGAVTTGTTSQINVDGGSIGSPVLAFTNGLTNDGSILLQNSQAGASAGLTVTGGPLLNSATGTIAALVGAGGGTRTITANVGTAGSISLTTPLTIDGVLTEPAGAPSSFTGNGSTLSVAGLNVDGALFDNVPLASNGGTLTLFDNVTFSNMDPTAVQLSITHPGAAATFLANGLTFSTPPTSGSYLTLTDSDGIAPFLVFEVLGSTPASGLAQSLVAGGAVLIW